MVKDAKKFTFNADQIRVPSARQLVYGDKRANSKGRLPDDTWVLRPQDLPQDAAQMTIPGTFHEWQEPSKNVRGFMGVRCQNSY